MNTMRMCSTIYQAVRKSDSIQGCDMFLFFLPKQKLLWHSRQTVSIEQFSFGTIVSLCCKLVLIRILVLSGIVTKPVNINEDETRLYEDTFLFHVDSSATKVSSYN
jgi:uncharacterized membrane protein